MTRTTERRGIRKRRDPSFIRWQMTATLDPE